MVMPPVGAWAGWPWIAGNIPSTSPLARAWWLGPNPQWGPLAGLAAWSRASLPAWNGWLAQVPPTAPRAAANGAGKRTAGGGYASYRSAGGHAVAQVIMGPVPGPAPGRPNGRALPPKRS
jgi:hypothetical protein